MEKLKRSISEANSYPSSLVCPDTLPYILDGIREELQAQASRIFCEDDSLSVDIIESYNGEKDAVLHVVRDHDDLQRKIQAPLYRDSQDPIWRMIFWYAGNARDSLYITLPMAQLILAYHQVMPSFMECVFSFGLREYGEACYWTAFHSRNFLTEPKSGLEVQQLGRSGRIMEHCYGLRSVEREDGPQNWPWEINLCSIYHSLDFESGQSFWIVIKANRLIEKLVRDAMLGEKYHCPKGSTSPGESITKALQIHEFVAQWCGSNWQFYVKYLEDKLQDITRQTLFIPSSYGFKHPADPPETISPVHVYDNKGIRSGEITKMKQICTSVRAYLAKIPILKARFGATSNSIPGSPFILHKHKVSFPDLPHVLDIQERANDALDTISSNEEILVLLREEYLSMSTTLQALPEWDNIEVALKHFDKTITDVQRSLRQQHGRLEKLLRVFRDRKTLFESVLNFESTRANQELAEKANVTAESMKLIAQETQLETVSMRVITLVTLFFLPGTFISTLMSTPIVTFSPGSSSTSGGSVSTGALGLFVAVSLPLVLLTFVTWWIVYWWEDRKQRRKLLQTQRAYVGPSNL